MSCPAGYYEEGGKCAKCSGKCFECKGPGILNCVTCGYSYEMKDGVCTEGCPADLSGLSEARREECELEATFLGVLWGLFRDFKCTYMMLLVMLVVMIMKLTCFNMLSMLVALVTISGNFETIAIIMLMIFMRVGDEEDKMGGFELAVFEAGPILFLVLLLLLNIYTTSAYMKSLGKPID